MRHCGGRPPTNDHSRLTLSIFMARSNLIPVAFFEMLIVLITVNVEVIVLARYV